MKDNIAAIYVSRAGAWTVAALCGVIFYAVLSI